MLVLESPSVQGLSLDALAAEICELAGQLAAASARWVLLIASEVGRTDSVSDRAMERLVELRIRA